MTSAQLPTPQCSWREWFVGISCNDATLEQILQSASHIAAGADEIPLIIKLVENPKFDFPGITLFNGAVDLQTHDCIHALLGRGLLPHDEAFTIGFTMGSTNRVSTTEERLFTLAAKYLYPGPYKFSNEDIEIFKDAIRLGYISDCIPLNEVDYSQYMSRPIGEVREAIGLETELLRAYYKIEVKRYPDARESQRLLT